MDKHTNSDRATVSDEDVDMDSLQQKLKLFVDEHERTLVELQQSFGTRSDAMVWNAESDVMKLNLGGDRAESTWQHKELTTSIADTLGSSMLSDQVFYRISLCFSSAMAEMHSLTREMHIALLPPLVLFGDDDGEGPEEEMITLGFQRMLGTLQSIWGWFERARDTIVYVVRQLSVLLSPTFSSESSAGALRTHNRYADARLSCVWTTLADLLGAALVLAEVLAQHSTLHRGLAATQKLASSRDAEKVQLDEGGAAAYSQLLRTLQQDLSLGGGQGSGSIMSRLLQRQSFDSVAPERIVVAGNALLEEEMGDMLAHMVDFVEQAVGTPRESEAPRKLCGVLGLHYLQISLFHSQKISPEALPARRHSILCQHIFSLHAFFPAVYIKGLFALRPAEWMVLHLPAELLRLASKNPSEDSNQAITDECFRKQNLLVPRLSHLTTLVSTWMAEMQASTPVDPAHYREFLTKTSLLIQRGLLLAHDVQSLLVAVVTLSLCADSLISVDIVDAVARGVQLLMMMRAVFHGKTGILAVAFNPMVRSIAHTMHKRLYAVHQALSRQENGREMRGESSASQQHSAIKQAIALLQNPCTLDNLSCLAVVLDLAFNRRTPARAETIDARQCDEILTMFAQLRRITQYQHIIREVTDCEFIYWHCGTFYPLFFRRLYAHIEDVSMVPYLVMAMHDSQEMTLQARHTSTSTAMYDAYVQFVRRCIKTEIIDPLCTDVETSLRLGTHAAMLGQQKQLQKKPGQSDTAESSPVEGATADDIATKHLALLTRLSPFHFFGEWMNIGAAVEDYLDVQFYYLGALMPNDWQVYEEMRHLAQVRYGLRVSESHLPGTNVDQGLDVLVITENIHVFVAKYAYNINEQLFLQRPDTTTSRHLHTLQIRHIVNSIRTHGTGIMNTAVNYVFKYLVKKLYVLSEFLNDDHVKSLLLSDGKFVQQQKKTRASEYPLPRAERFAREMEKLGVAKDGKSFLDKFRQLVTEIGNAVGFVRLMRSGGLRAIAEAAAFAPNLTTSGHACTHIAESMDLVAQHQTKQRDGSGNGVPTLTSPTPQPTAASTMIAAVKNVDLITAGIAEKLSGGSEYFSLLLHTLAERLQIQDATKRAHLQLFHLIVPAICVRHTEYMMGEKEKLVRNNKSGGLFTDDGFAMGCTFLLALFDAVEMFASLHWFEGVRQYCDEELHSLQTAMSALTSASYAGGISNVSGQDTLHSIHLAMSMTDTMLREYIGLEEAFVSSTIFFHRSLPVSVLNGGVAVFGKWTENEEEGV